MSAIPTRREIEFLSHISGDYDRFTDPKSEAPEVRLHDTDALEPLAGLPKEVRATILNYESDISSWINLSGLLNPNKNSETKFIIESSARDHLIKLKILPPNAEPIDPDQIRRDDEKLSSHEMQNKESATKESEAAVEEVEVQEAQKQVKVSFTKKLMVHVFQTVMTKVSDERRADIIDLATSPNILPAAKSRYQKTTMKVQKFFIAVLRNQLVQIAIACAMAYLAIQIYMVAYALFNTYVLATLVPKLATLLINYAPAVIIQGVSATVAVVNYICIKQLLIYSSWCSAAMLTRPFPRLNRAVNIIGKTFTTPIRLLVNIFFFWPIKIASRSATFSRRTQEVFANFLNNMNVTQRARFISEGERRAKSLWLKLTVS